VGPRALSALIAGCRHRARGLSRSWTFSSPYNATKGTEKGVCDCLAVCRGGVILVPDGAVAQVAEAAPVPPPRLDNIPGYAGWRGVPRRRRDCLRAGWLACGCRMRRCPGPSTVAPARRMTSQEYVGCRGDRSGCRIRPGQEPCLVWMPRLLLAGPHDAPPPPPLTLDRPRNAQPASLARRSSVGIESHGRTDHPNGTLRRNG
jgi:hypothetical protein